ncbi:MAG: RDD family protein [Bacilli bacterium]|nr:RDD family protein [Bacilli bacterium]
MEPTLNLTYKAPEVRRILAAHAFDFFLSILLSFLFIVTLHQPLSHAPFFVEQTAKRSEIQIDSKLYVKENDAVITLVDCLEKEGDTANRQSEALDEAMDYFFAHFIDAELGGKGKETYLSLKAEGKLRDQAMFDGEGKRVLLSPDDDMAYLRYYRDLYGNRVIGYLRYNADYRAVSATLIWMELGVDALSAFLAFGVFYLLIPLCFRRGKSTLGMRLTRLSYVGLNGLSCPWWKVLLSYLFFVPVVVIGSLVAFLIPLGVSITLLSVRKQRQSLANYVLGIYPVSHEGRRVFLSEFEARRYQGETSF